MTANGEAPVLQTARLILRPFRADDVGGQPLAREDSWRKLLCGAGLWRLFGFGYWAVERRSDGTMIGQVGFAEFQRDLSPSIRNIPEMGWLFTRDAAGQGYATEAAMAGLAWIDAALAPPETVAIIDNDNSASIRVAEKCGFALREPAVYRDEPILLFRRPRG
jgi:RimJ/RimL family protein N-acetyltransferase